MHFTMPITINATLSPEKARELAGQAGRKGGRLIEENVYQHLTNGKRPSGKPGKVRQ